MYGLAQLIDQRARRRLFEEHFDFGRAVKAEVVSEEQFQLPFDPHIFQAELLGFVFGYPEFRGILCRDLKFVIE